MSWKTKVTKSLTLKTLIPDIKKEFFNSIGADLLEEEVRDTLKSGKTTVKGGGAWKQYNAEYADKEKGGRRKPVDMTGTGKMLDSLEVRPTKSSYVIRFKSIIADYHNRLGAGKSKVIRRLLPSNRGERFIPSIEKIISKLADVTGFKVAKKQNRK
jgi:hypothetical protein